MLTLPFRSTCRLAFVAATLLLLGACQKHEDAAAKGPLPVRVRALEPSAATGSSRYSGTIEPGTRVDLAFRVGGYIRALGEVKKDGQTRKLQEGDFVKKGTVLAVVREADYEQKVAAAEAALAEATAAQKQASLDFDRAAKLVANDTVAKAELDNAGARRDAANARVEAAKAQVGEAKLAVSDCTLRAPMDGVVLKRAVEVGSLVGPGALGVVLADTSSVKIVFGVPDVIVAKMKLGSEVAITLDAVPGEQKATVSRIAPSADPKSRVFDIEATLPNPNDDLKVGMIGSLKLTGGEKAPTSLVLPLTAVVRSPHDPRGFSVFVVEGGAGAEVARLRDVKLGEVMGNTVLVTENLKPGDRVISMGATLAVDGESVRVIP